MDVSDKAALESKLKEDMGTCHWDDLKDHVARDSVIMIAPSLELLEAAVAVAQDNSQKVAEWVQEGLVTKPAQEQATHYEDNPTTVFRVVIVQPLVLVQELTQ